MDICFTFDKKYIQHVSVAIKSIISNSTNEKLIFHLVYSNISKFSIKILVKWIKNNGYKVFCYKVNPKDFKHCPCIKNDRLPRIAYYRINLPNILPPDIKKVLYFDPDIVVKKDLSELYNTEMQNKPLAAVMVTKDYFNSGVLLYNLDYWRKNNISEKVLSYIAENASAIEYHDQDALNFILENQWLKLPPKYNAGINILDILAKICNDSDSSPYTLKELEEAYKSPVIIHYAGSFHFKPWYKDTLHPHQDQYLKYLKDTPYKNNKLKKHYILSIMKKHDNPYFYIKEHVHRQIKDAFVLHNKFSHFIIRKMYNNQTSRSLLFNVLTRILYVQECN